MRARLTGSYIQLIPLELEHKEVLWNASQNPDIWAFTTTNPLGDHFDAWFEKAWRLTSEGKQQMFVVERLSDKQVIGSTRYYDVSHENKRIMIGYTWYVPEEWGTKVNPECKLLVMQHAFETMNFNRIEFAVDSRNQRSRGALLKLGAKEEGLLRQHIVLANGYVRDTVIFSVIKSEWQMIKNKLLARLSV
jgi:N-acetyltransferase